MYNNSHCTSFPGQISHISMEKWYTKFVNKNKFYIKWSHIVLLHIKIRLQHQGRYDCIRTLTIAINKGIKFSNKKFWQIKNKPVYILFTNHSEVCCVFNKFIICILNKPNQSGDKTKWCPFHEHVYIHVYVL